MRGVGVPPGDVPSPSSELQEPPPTPAVPAPAVRPATLTRHPGPGSLLPPVQAATCGGRGGHTPHLSSWTVVSESLAPQCVPSETSRVPATRPLGGPGSGV